MKFLAVFIFTLLLQTMVAQKIQVNAEMKELFPVFKKENEKNEGCLTGDCMNGEGIYFQIHIWSVGDERTFKTVDRPTYLHFYVGKFEENGKVFIGKKYVHFTTFTHKAFKKEVVFGGVKNTRIDFKQSENADLSWFLERSNIQAGLPLVEGRMISETENQEKSRAFVPDGECVVRSLAFSTDNVKYAQIKGIFVNGISTFVEIDSYTKNQLNHKIFAGRTISLQMFREGKVYSQSGINTKITDSVTYYMGELLGNLRHGRGYQVIDGTTKQDGFWFLNKFIDFENFDEKNFISYQNLEKANLDNISIMGQTGFYSGTISNGKPHGFGSFSNDWFTYHGYFSNGFPQGNGTFTQYKPTDRSTNVYYEVETYVGTFDKGKIKKGQFAYINLMYSQDYKYFNDRNLYYPAYNYFASFGSIYSGNFNENGRLEGDSASIDRIRFSKYDNNYGMDYLKTSSTSGSFKNGELDGWGSDYFESLYGRSGYFVKGKLNGQGHYFNVQQKIEQEGFFVADKLVAGTSKENGIVKTGTFKDGKLTSGSVSEEYTRLKPDDVIVVGGKEVMVVKAYYLNGIWTVLLSNNLTYQENFNYSRSVLKSSSDYYETSNCNSCYGTGVISQQTKSTYMPSYQVETYYLVTTKVTKTYYNHGGTVTTNIDHKCNVCNGTGKLKKLK